MKVKRTYPKIKRLSLKVGDFLEKKGFYLVIFLCLIVIGATMAVVSIRDYQKLKIDTEYNENPVNEMDKGYVKDKNTAKTEDSVTQTVAAKVAEKAKVSVEPAIKNDSKNISAAEPKTKKLQVKNIPDKNANPTGKKENRADKTKKENSTKKIVEEPLALDWPVFGKIINDYAKDSLIFSKTLQQWTIHDGIDIYSEKGTPVRVAAEGIVKSIKSDPMYGITITVEHKNGLRTIYSNLSTGKMVKVAETVKRGKVISGIGTSAGAECEDQPHLHFEIYDNGSSVDPKKYLPAM